MLKIFYEFISLAKFVEAVKTFFVYTRGFYLRLTGNGNDTIDFKNTDIYLRQITAVNGIT